MEQKIISEFRTRCKRYSRVVGYIRPVENWNDAKQIEFKNRKVFDEKKSLENAKNLPI